MDALNAAQRMQMIEKFETLTIKEYRVLIYENEQLRQRVAELEKERDAALAEVALLKPNPLCDTGCMLSCKMEADYYEKEITTMKSALREAKRKIAFLVKSGDWCDAEKTIAEIDKALGEEK